MQTSAPVFAGADVTELQAASGNEKTYLCSFLY
jgi:hypothetical protein